MLEENIGGSAVDEGPTRSATKSIEHTPKNKKKTIIESSPAVLAESSKRKLRKQKKEAEKKHKMEVIEKAMRALEEQKALLVGGGKPKVRLTVRSPRESSKDQPWKHAVVPIKVSKGRKVSQSKGGRKVKSDSVDSPTASLPAKSHIISDPHAIGIWDTVRDVPPCEVNSEGVPVGRFWEHMQRYTHDRAPWLFEWDVPWPQQPKELKRAFANRVRSLYPGKYEMDYVLEDVATNIRQKRQRTRNHMKKMDAKNLHP